MAHGFLQSFDNNITVCSAGTDPAKEVNPKAVLVMREARIDISKHYPKLVDQYLNEEWNFVITVCDNANESCPAFYGKVKSRIHIGFEDPSNATGSPEFIINEFRRVRDEIHEKFSRFYLEKIKSQL
jgi:arsenate reductase